MNTQNVSFQSLRLLCSGAKARLLHTAFLVCVIGSTWAQSLPESVIRFRGTLVAAESRQNYPDAQGGMDLAEGPPTLFLVTAAGRATTAEFGYPLLGSFTVIYAGMVDYTTGAGQQCTRFINVNGDSLFSSSSAQVRATNDPRVTSVVEFHTVIGGTGYFAGTSGTFTVNRMVKLAADGLTASSTGSFDGLITWTSIAAVWKEGSTP